ncbi:MAG: thioredoxin-disulfide reductase [Flavobacteriales bacterium]|jgi:thioredoxin reductase (NADPH)|uniref:thioredoxin-disulfide reductase n=1 Tax=Blattabacterium sp. (Mastotermes darwiniensis) TaxID=39768 RepID=UPI000231DF17|nr:thioredoxin-disulfide reductase [Blattabacterium sp. (Mastotermes darwiniensis)]AER40843.1 thioredoxin reductase [Blattabacterium sp. (Mastotermes darwiniensis) str. MADAR]MDR1804690.1 thioredoxin-disulfide reductase [Flavobacteriales bacterium]
MSRKKIVDCVIIGSGPAGYSAAIYASRADLNTMLFVGFQPGGQLTSTINVDNYPGFPKGISGKSLMENCKKQAKRFNTIIIHKTITEVHFSSQKGGIHCIKIEDEENIVESKGIIIATGSSPKFLGIDKEKKLMGLGVSFCATCDGFFHKGKDVAVIGGGDTALEEASYLSKICKNVYLVVRKNYLRASKILQHRILKKKNVNIFFCSKITEIIGDNFLEGIRIFNEKTRTSQILFISGLFIAIGHSPNTELFKNKLDMDEKGYIIVKKGSTCTNKPGVFAAGDVQDPIYRQAITSAGTGCMAALDLERYLYCC